MKNPVIPRIYIDPREIITKTNFLVNKYGIKEFIKNKVFKKIKEKYIAACYLIGIRSVDNLLYWISSENSEAPDVMAARFRENDIGRAEEQINIEVMTWTDFDKRSLARAIIEKLSGKAYPKYFNLICYVQKTGGQFVPFMIFKELSRLVLNIGEVFIVAETGNDSRKFTLCKVYPEFKVIKVDMRTEIEKFKSRYPAPFIKTSFGLHTEIHDLGKAFYSYDAGDNDEIKRI